jgi:hypothetical protein
MMIRTQIELDEEEWKALRQCSTETGRSVADLVREGIRLYLSSRKHPREEQVRRAIAAIGKYRSGLKDGSVNHDRYLADDVR